MRNEISIKNKKFKYYSSPILSRNKFIHGFFTKSFSPKYLTLISAYFKKNFGNCFLNQAHTNNIVFGSSTFYRVSKIEADGIISNEFNQNLWIYTADCMPIMFADKKKRYIAAIHCGRRGLEKKIIKNLIKIFDSLGSSRNDILIAIGPSISKKNYLIDKKTSIEFEKNVENSEFTSLHPKAKNIDNLMISKKYNPIQLDLKKHAFIQLLNENIPNKNIEISGICTYDSHNEFNSWRRNPTTSRQWNFIFP